MNLKQATLLLLAATLILSSCKKDPEPIVLTQAILNSSTSLVESLTGQQNGMDFPHNGSGISSDSTTRDIYSTTGSIGSVSPGTIITKHTFLNDANGNKSDLQVTFAMIKHLEGWWPEGNDWEYVVMPNTGTTDYSANPNGVLPTDVTMIGQLTGCNGCHAGAAGNDSLFSND